MRGALRVVIAVLLLLDGLGAAAGIAARLPMVAAYPALTLIMVAARGIIGALEAMAGWMLLERRPPAVPMARLAVVLSALHITLGLGARLAPTNIDPTFRIPVVVGYWIVAALVWLALAERERTVGRRLR